jgi:hypothetical protein
MIGLGLAAAGTGLAKLGIGAKLASALGMAKGLAGGAKATQLAIPGLKAVMAPTAAQAATGFAAREAARTAAGTAIKGGLGGVKKFAGKALADYMGPGGVTAGNIAANFAPDAVFGVMQGAMTPGDLGDKIIAGGSTAIGGALGGVGAVSALGKFGQQGGGRMLGEFGGGIVGDMLGQSAGDVLLRAKGGGVTPWEKLQQEGDQEYRQQLERQILAQYGIGGYNQTDLLG